jgi:hypothetical protein
MAALTPKPIAPPPCPVSMASAAPPDGEVEHPQQGEGEDGGPEAAIQRSAGIVFIHSMTAKPARAVPRRRSPTRGRGERVVPRTDDGAGVRREEAITLTMASRRRTERQRPPARSGR